MLIDLLIDSIPGTTSRASYSLFCITHLASGLVFNNLPQFPPLKIGVIRIIPFSQVYCESQMRQWT